MLCCKSACRIGAFCGGFIYVVGLFMALSYAGAHVSLHAQAPQRLSSEQRTLARNMLSDIADDVRKNYYDPKMRGLDWNALVSQTRAQIDAAPNLETANAEIGALLERLQDSHTFFVPPQQVSSVDYGWTFQAIGNRSFVTYVKSGSDADRQGMKPGDEVLTLDGFTVERASALRLQYAINVIVPRPVLHVYLRNTAGKIRKLDVTSVVTQWSHTPIADELVPWKNRLEYEKSSRLMDPRTKDFGPQLLVIKVPAFSQFDGDVDSLFKKARGHDAVIVDLRGNPGGAVDSVMRYLDDVFDSKVKVADVVSREKPHAMTVNPNPRDMYEGKLFVLIDSESASAAEVFARTVQLQGRGKILGDVSSGSVMEAQQRPFRDSGSSGGIYGDSVTIADLLMGDGHSLEGHGVIPDQVILPTAADLADSRDPVLVQAAAMAGVTLTPEAAWKLFPHNVQPQ